MAEAAPSHRPIMRLLDLLGRRWALRVLWELRLGPLRSRALRQACGDISPTVLQSRLDELRAAGIVARDPQRGYGLTTRGEELLAAFAPLNAFAARWGDQARAAEGDNLR